MALKSFRKLCLKKSTSTHYLSFSVVEKFDRMYCCSGEVKTASVLRPRIAQLLEELEAYHRAASQLFYLVT